MQQKTLTCIGVLLACLTALHAQGPPQGVSSYRTLLDRYCITCHNEKLNTGNLTLAGLDLSAVGAKAAVWEKVVRKLRAGAMPPAGSPRPDASNYESLANYLETELDQAAAANPDPGRTVIRRLNRFQYVSAVRDLLKVTVDPSLLPTDDSTYGFDNIADSLTISPVLFERYMSAAGKISRLAVGDPTIRPVVESYTLPKYSMQEDRESEDLPFGSRGGAAIHHYFPVDGEYEVQVRLQRNTRDYIRGLNEAHQIELRLDGETLQLFSIGGEHRGRSAPIFSTARMGDPEQEDYEHTADAKLKVRFRARAGTRVLGIYFVDQTVVPEGPLRPRITLNEFTQYKGGEPAVGTVTVSGPFNITGPGETPARNAIFGCRPSNAEQEQSCAKDILKTLARRAYRRPATEQDLEVLLPFFQLGRNREGFERGIQVALERILIAPSFLFRIERNSVGAPQTSESRISDLELASRLSFFLWSSIPDDELLTLAEQGKLHDPATLEIQVRRMLADARSKALITSFASQWLNIRSLSAAKPDPEAFPDFDDTLLGALQQETELFLESLVREDRSVVELLNANYTFVNERLARHYGMPNIYGGHFRRVTLSSEERWGLLGKGGILTATSYANRTSPVLRGKWILENVLGAPPPPPPPNVPALKEGGSGGKFLTMRQRMEQHRANPVCAGCHKQMDPLGFALENFDGLGKWRIREGSIAIDSTGALPDGTAFDGPSGLRRLLLTKREEFVKTVTEKLLIYALGRGLEYYDAPVLRKIVRDAKTDDYGWSSVILGVVRSTPFQFRRSAEHP